MAALPYIQLYVADYLADTAHLTAAQHGAYLLLIFNYWQRGHALNNANERLTNVARMSSEEWADTKPVLQEFFEIDGDTWVHPRIERDLEAVRAKSTKASNAGKASAASKLNGRSTDVEQTFNHTDTDTDTDTDILLAAPEGAAMHKKVNKIKKASTRRTALQGEWVIEEGDERDKYAKQVGMTEADIDIQCDKFENFHRGKGNLMADWDAAWRTWCRNWQDYKQARKA